MNGMGNSPILRNQIIFCVVGILCTSYIGYFYSRFVSWFFHMTTRHTLPYMLEANRYFLIIGYTKQNMEI